MTVHPYSREGSVERASKYSSDLAAAVQVADSELYEPLLLSSSDESLVAERGHYLLAGVYVAASYNVQEDQINLGVMRFMPPNQLLTATSREVISDAILGLPLFSDLELIDPAVLKQTLRAIVVDQRLASSAWFLGGVEMRSPTIGPDSYTALITPKILRRATRVLSERMLQLDRDGRTDEIPGNYRDFAYTQDDVQTVAHRVTASTLSYLNETINIAGVDATIDSEPRDTH